MPYDHMTRNLNQSIFSLILASIFSFLLLLIFPAKETYIFAIFEIPLVFFIGLLVVTECLYSYKDAVSIENTINMIGGVLRTFLLSIPTVLFYSAIIIILKETIPAFEQAIKPLFEEQIQGIDILLAIPLISYIPIFIMIFSSPLFLYIYGKIHVLIWGKPWLKRKEKKSIELEVKEKEYREKVLKLKAELDQYLIQLHQYFLELQAFDQLIDDIDSHEKYKGLKMRLDMMRAYITSIEDTINNKENKDLLKEEDIRPKVEELKMQKSTLLKKIDENTKKLEKEKGEYAKPPKEEEESL
ncbi:MAG: hypothetical protein ACTSYD_11485 [Candidatus Heimdallarchaeaceae archaeon]